MTATFAVLFQPQGLGMWTARRPLNCTPSGGGRAPELPPQVVSQPPNTGGALRCAEPGARRASPPIASETCPTPRGSEALEGGSQACQTQHSLGQRGRAGQGRSTFRAGVRAQDSGPGGRGPRDVGREGRWAAQP